MKKVVLIKQLNETSLEELIKEYREFLQNGTCHWIDEDDMAESLKEFLEDVQFDDPVEEDTVSNILNGVWQEENLKEIEREKSMFANRGAILNWIHELYDCGYLDDVPLVCKPQQLFDLISKNINKE